jgi:hypothetical protein
LSVKNWLASSSNSFPMKWIVIGKKFQWAHGGINLSFKVCLRRNTIFQSYDTVVRHKFRSCDKKCWTYDAKFWWYDTNFGCTTHILVVQHKFRLHKTNLDHRYDTNLGRMTQIHRSFFIRKSWSYIQPKF